MKLLNHFRLLSIAMLLLALTCPSITGAADAPAKKDAQTVLNEMRLKKWTKDLELTQEQQKKVQFIFDAESREITKLNEDANLSINERRAKVGKLHEETYAKMKPILTPAQLEKFEKLLKPVPKKK